MTSGGGLFGTQHSALGTSLVSPSPEFSMLAFVIRRLLTFIPMLLFLAFAAFVLSYYGPGDPIRLIMGENWTSDEVYQSLRHQYGLDRPLLVQFGDYLWHALQGDLGRSYIQRV